MERSDKKQVVQQVREEASELAALLEDFSGRLRRLRQRNRQVQEEIEAFEKELVRLRDIALDASD